MFDFHMHSNFSNDSTQTLQEIIASALKKSLQGICITDHVDIDYCGDTPFDIDFTNYQKEVLSFREKYKNQLNIFIGLEIGLQPKILKKCELFLADKKLDFVLGSIHCAKEKELYQNSYLEGKTDHEGILDYFEDLILCVESYWDFDALGHLDVVRRYLNKGEESFCFKTYYEYIRHVLYTLIKNHKGIELNTSALRYGLKSFHPLHEILKLYKELGGEIITTGSDAHRPDGVGYMFKEAHEALDSCGFKYYTIFKERKPEFIKIK